MTCSHVLQGCCLLALFLFLINHEDALINSYMHDDLLNIVFCLCICLLVSNLFLCFLSLSFLVFLFCKSMGKAKKIGGNASSTPIDKSKPTIASKISKANKVDELGIFGCKKLIQERGIDLDSCVGSYVHDVLMSRNWGSWVNMLGISNETVVREFYHAYKSSSTVTSATLSIRKVVFRVCSRKVNEFLDLPDDIESEFLDVDILENLDLMGRTLCDDNDFVWGKRACIRQGELTKISAFWHLFVCSNLIVSTNASELNRDKIKIVYALVTNQPINLGELLVEQI